MGYGRRKGAQHSPENDALSQADFCFTTGSPQERLSILEHMRSSSYGRALQHEHGYAEHRPRIDEEALQRLSSTGLFV